MMYHTLIRGVQVVDGTGAPPYRADVAIENERVVRIAQHIDDPAHEVVEAEGLYLTPGFIDVHTHDDLEVIHRPEMTAKLSQGVTTVIVGNCGISASPVQLNKEPPDPLNLLGERTDFQFPCFTDYAQAVQAARPAVNVAALVGHTALRITQMSELQRTATESEIEAMRKLLRSALEQGAIGMSSGLAYYNAKQSDTAEVMALVRELTAFDAIYTTHLRTEFDQIIEAMDEALETAREGQVPLVVSHLKCAGKGNWGRSGEVLSHLQSAASLQRVACDCYPYSASSSTLDLEQVTPESEVTITWSRPFPEQGGRPLSDIAEQWGVSLQEAAQKLQPAGAVYHCMDPNDVEAILRHPLTMIGSDGLPKDPHPHPRLWGAFPRVLAHYCRERKLFDVATAVHKMSGRSAEQFRLRDRGVVKEGAFADLVLLDFERIESTATFEQPQQAARGIEAVWVNGTLSYEPGQTGMARNGRMLLRDH